MGNPRFSGTIRGLWVSKTSGKKVFPAMASYTIENLDYLKDLVASGRLKAVIDKRYTLDQVADAHRYVESGNKTGNVVITIHHSSNL